MILSSLLTWTALIANHALIERLHSKDRTAAPSGARPKGAPTPPGIVSNV